jgi:mycoredoxin
MPSDAITVYWRPGCAFSAALLRRLDRAGLEFERRDIWEDPAAADYVRSVARGNETVPTVRVGTVPLVNPSATTVLRTVAEVLPDRLPEGWQAPEPGPLGRTVRRLLGG